jgi:hypothetical protein
MLHLALDMIIDVLFAMIELYPIQSNPIQSNPIQSNPIVHRQGVAIHGGAGSQRKARIDHSCGWQRYRSRCCKGTFDEWLSAVGSVRVPYSSVNRSVLCIG